MNCHLEAVYKDGKRIRLETHPNGQPDSIYPSRGWARASANMAADSYAGAYKNRKATEDETPKTIDVVLEDTGKIYCSIKVE